MDAVPGHAERIRPVQRHPSPRSAQEGSNRSARVRAGRSHRGTGGIRRSQLLTREAPAQTACRPPGGPASGSNPGATTSSMSAAWEQQACAETGSPTSGRDWSLTEMASAGVRHSEDASHRQRRRSRPGHACSSRRLRSLEGHTSRTSRPLGPQAEGRHFESAVGQPRLRTIRSGLSDGLAEHFAGSRAPFVPTVAAITGHVATTFVPCDR